MTHTATLILSREFEREYDMPSIDRMLKRFSEQAKREIEAMVRQREDKSANTPQEELP